MLGSDDEMLAAMLRPIIEIEAEAGILSRPGAHDDCLVVFRDVAQRQDELDGVGDTQTDDEFAALQKKRLFELKKRIRAVVGDQLIEFKVDAPSGALPGRYYQDFETTIYDRLSRIVREQLSEFEDFSGQVEDQEEHTRIRARYMRSYVPRRDFEDGIRHAIESDAEATATPLVIVGPSGSGKTALIASFSAQAKTRLPTARTYYRFVGSTPRSGNPAQLIADLLQEIGETVEEAASPDALPVLMQTFRRVLEKGTHEALYIFIDGVDRLDLPVPSSAVDWLPTRLAGSVRVILSVNEGEVADHLKSLLPPDAIFVIPPLNASEATAIVARRLALQQRQVQPHQMAALVNAALNDNARPLYLRLVSFMAAGWKHDFDPSKHLPDSLPDAIDAAIRVIQEKGYHGAALMRKVLGQVAASRFGIAEPDLLQQLERDGGVLEEFLKAHPFSPKVATLPPIVWYRLAEDIREFLAERILDGVVIFDLFHQSIDEAVKRGIGADEMARHHQELAELYNNDRLYSRWLGQVDNRSPNTRPLRLLPFHLTHAGPERQTQLVELLWDFDFLMAKCQAGEFEDLLDDFRRARALIEAAPTELKRAHDFLSDNAHLLRRGNKDWHAGRILLQIAAEAPPAHRVRESAEAWLKAGYCRWFWLQNFWQRPHFPGLNALQGHTSRPNGFIAIDSEVGISWSEDGSMRSWNLDSGRLLREFRGHEGSVTAVVPLPPNRILSWGADGTVRCWDVPSARELAQLRPHDGAPIIVRPLRDGRFLSLSREDQTLRVWRMSATPQQVVMDVNASALKGSVDGNSSQRGERFFRGDLYVPMLPETGSSFFTTMSGGLLQLDDDHFVTWSMGGVAVWSIAEAGRIADISWFVYEQPSHVLPAGESTLKVLTSSGAEYEWDWHDQTAKRLHQARDDAGISEIDDSRLFVWAAQNPEARHGGGPDLIEFRILNRTSGALERTGLLKNFRTDPPGYFRGAMSLVPRGIFPVDQGRLCAWSGVGIDLVDMDAGRVDSIASFDIQNFVMACAPLSASEILLVAEGHPLRFDLERREVTSRFRSTLNNIEQIRMLDSGRLLLIVDDGTLWLWNAGASATAAADESTDDFLVSTAILDVDRCEQVGYGLAAVSYLTPEQSAYVDIFSIYPAVRLLKRVTHARYENETGRIGFRTLNQLVFSWSKEGKIHVTDAYSGGEIQMTIGDGAPVVALVPFHLQPCELPIFGSERGEVLAAALSSEGSVSICAPYHFHSWKLHRASPPKPTGISDELKFEHERWLLLRQSGSLDVWDASSVSSLTQSGPAVSFVVAAEPGELNGRDSTSIVEACVLPAGGVVYVTHEQSKDGESHRAEPFTMWRVSAGDSAPVMVRRFTAGVWLLHAVDDRHILFSATSSLVSVCDISTGDVRPAAQLAAEVEAVTRAGQTFIFQHKNGATTLWQVNDHTEGQFLIAAPGNSDEPLLIADNRRFVLRSPAMEDREVAQWHDTFGGKVICALQSGSFLILLANGQLTLLQARYGNEIADLYHVRCAPQPPAVPWMAHTNILDYALPTVLESVYHLMRVGVLDRAYTALENPEELIAERPLAQELFFRLLGERCRLLWAVGETGPAEKLIEQRDEIIESLPTGNATMRECFDRDLRALEIAMLAERYAGSDLLAAIVAPGLDATRVFDPDGGGVVRAAVGLLIWNLRVLEKLEASELPARRRVAIQRIAEVGQAHVAHDFWNSIHSMLGQPQQPSGEDSPAERTDPDIILKDELYPDELKPVLMAAAQGDADSMLELGRDFGLGLRGLEKNIFHSMAWYRRASDHGSDMAAFNLAQIYRHGDVGVLPDAVESVRWLEVAAARGNVMAQTNLANSLAGGIGVEKDVERARVLLEKSVEAGDLIAYFSLALLYFYGEGIPRDRARARQLALEGARKGDANCARFLQEFFLTVDDADANAAEASSAGVEGPLTGELKTRVAKALESIQESLDEEAAEEIMREAAAVVGQIDRRVIDHADKDFLADITLLLHAYAARLLQADDTAGALSTSLTAIDAAERLVFDLGQYHYYLLLAGIFMNHGSMLKRLEQWPEALDYYEKGIQGFRRVPEQYMGRKQLCQYADGVIIFAETCWAVEAYARASGELLSVRDRLDQALQGQPDPELAERAVRVEAMLAIVDSKGGELSMASARLEDRLSTWLAEDAAWHGDSWAKLIIHIIMEADELHSFAQGEASAAMATRGLLDKLYRLVDANGTPGLRAELSKDWQTYTDLANADAQEDE
ncbi:MAG TPA: NACHT domain-containing protein [Pyrinomonadaceae bacterium]